MDLLKIEKYLNASQTRISNKIGQLEKLKNRSVEQSSIAFIEWNLQLPDLRQ